MKASVSDVVEFTRKGYKLNGRVIDIRPSTVMVELSEKHAALLGYDNCITIVNHKNYKVQVEL